MINLIIKETPLTQAFWTPGEKENIGKGPWRSTCLDESRSDYVALIL